MVHLLGLINLVKVRHRVFCPPHLSLDGLLLRLVLNLGCVLGCNLSLFVFEKVNVLGPILLVGCHLHKCFRGFSLSLICIYFQVIDVSLYRSFRYLVIVCLIILVYFALDQAQVRLHIYCRLHQLHRLTARILVRGDR